MIKSKLKKSILSALVCAGVLCQGGVNAFADTKVYITTEVTTISMTVPGTMAVVLKSDGTTQFPDNFTITNNGSGRVALVEVAVDSSSTDWKFCTEAEDIESKPVDTKEVEFKIGVSGNMKLLNPTNGTVDDTATATFDDTDIRIDAKGGEQTLEFEMKHASFSEVIDAAEAFDMTLTFDLV